MGFVARNKTQRICRLNKSCFGLRGPPYGRPQQRFAGAFGARGYGANIKKSFGLHTRSRLLPTLTDAFDFPTIAAILADAIDPDLSD
jgi:hypothetical protein